MTGAIIVNKFQKYLDITSKKYVRELGAKRTSAKNNDEITAIDNEIKSHKDYIEKFKINISKDGCLGFSICHAVMDSIGKLPWWEELLVKLTIWEETEESLEYPVSLTDTDGEYQSYDNLFNRALNYIFYHQVEFTDSPVADVRFWLEGTTQFNLLQPADIDKKTPFELSTASNKPPEVIKNRAIAAGYFEKDDMLKLLDGNQIKGNICIVRGDDHFIRIGYDGQKWMIYDTSFDHTKLESIHRLGNKDEIVDVIFNQLQTHSLAIQIATVKDNQQLNFPHFDNIVKYSGNLTKESGLHMLAKYRPDAAYKRANIFRPSTADELSKKDYAGWTGLHVLARCAPDAAGRLFKNLSNVPATNNLKKNIVDTIGNTLGEKINDGNTCLHLLAYYAPDAMHELYMLANKTDNPTLLDGLIKTLYEKNNGGETCLSLLSFTNPNKLYDLFNLAKASANKELLNAFEYALLEKTKEGVSGFSILVHRSPDIARELFKSYVPIAQPSVLSSLVQDLLSPNDINQNLDVILKTFSMPIKGSTVWEIIAQDTEQFPKIMSTIGANLHKLTNEQLIELGNKLRVASYDPTSDYYGLCFDTVFDKHSSLFSNKQTSSTWQSLMANIQTLIKERQNQLTITPDVNALLNLRI